MDDIRFETFEMREDILRTSPSEISDFCGQVLDSDRLDHQIEQGSFFPSAGRRALYQYLGIGESTLSGWMKDRRMPKMDREAYVLLGILASLKDHIKDLKARIANLEGSAGDLRILEVSGAYQFCAFERREGGAVIGRIVADGIKSSGDARLLASSAQVRRLLEQAIDRVNHGSDSGEALMRQIFACLQYVSNLEHFKEDFGDSADGEGAVSSRRDG